MRLKFTIVVVLLVTASLFYSSCRKNQQVVLPVKVDTMQLSATQLAANLTQTLAGSYGGINISSGLIIPGFATTANQKVNLNGMNPICLFVPDSVISFKTNIGDTLKSSTSGLFKFYFKCDTTSIAKVFFYTALKGFAAFDSLATTGTGPQSTFTYNTKQFYSAKALDSTNYILTVNGSTNKLISVDGTIKSFADVTNTADARKSTSVHAFYSLTGLVVDITQNDFTGGTATFTALGTTNNIKWYYAGTITFLGNHKAAILINHKTFTADLLTGVVTALK